MTPWLGPSVIPHTPGPFLFQTYEIVSHAGDWQSGEGGYYVHQQRGRLVARFPMSQEPRERGRDIAGEQRANAILLVIAPAVLAAGLRLLELGSWSDDGTFVYAPPRTRLGAVDRDACPVTAIQRAIAFAKEAFRPPAEPDEEPAGEQAAAEKR